MTCSKQASLQRLQLAQTEEVLRNVLLRSPMAARQVQCLQSPQIDLNR